MSEKLSLVKRFLRHFRSGSGEFQDAVEDNLTFDREQVDVKLAELTKTARNLRKSADAFIGVAELVVKDLRPELRGVRDGKKGTARNAPHK